MITLVVSLAFADPVIPELAGQTIGGVEHTLPQTLSAERTVLMFGFQRNHDETFHQWRPLVEPHVGTGRVDWLELPFIDVGWALKGIIGVAMRGLDEPQRAHTMVLWTSPEPTMTALDIPSDSEAVVVVVDRDGEVLWRAEGLPTETAKVELAALLTELPRD